MKVGILTFHCAHNYGAMIQAYALQEQLRLMGHDSYIIDHRPDYLVDYYPRSVSFKSCIGTSFKATVKSLLNKIICSSIMAKRYDGFQNFYKTYMKLADYPSENGFSDFDYIVLGSDQIWFDSITGSISGPYYGDGINCKVIAYAASSRYKFLTEKQQADFKRVLSKLSSVGVRELSFAKLLQPLTDKKVHVNLDPTLLVSKEVFENLDLQRPIKEKYVLTYEVSTNLGVQEMVKEYAKANGLKIISLTGHFNMHFIGRTFDLKASPRKMLAYIKYADCVFTTSFHGTALSLVFEKPFYSIRQNNSADDRMDSLLTQLGLVQNFIEMTERPVTCSIDYDVITPRLQELRRDSINYIKESII